MTAELPPPVLDQLDDASFFDRVRDLTADVRTKLGRTGASALLVAGTAVGLVVTDAPPAMAAGLEATVGMPFTGRWAYNSLVNPPYTDTNSSHPSLHAAYGFDWATDFYAGSGTEVKVYGSSAQGTVTFKRKSTSDTCSSYGANIAGRGVTFDVLVNGTDVGDVKYDHLDLIDIGGDPIANGSKIGTVTSEPLNSSCFQTWHVHVQFKNTDNYACYTDHGQPGTTVAEGASLGRVGSDNNGMKQVCGPESAPPPPPPPNTDGDSLYDFEDACPTVYGTPLLYGCPAEHKTEGDFNGDGFGDFMVSSVYPDGQGMAMHLYKGSTGGLTGPDFQQELTPTTGGWTFRQSKMVATNVNGDAYTDLVIFHQGPSDEVARHVLKGSAIGIQASDPNMVAIQYPHQGWKWSNLRIAGGGDFNGDGYGDVAMFSAYPNGEDAALYSFQGSPTGLTPVFQRELTSGAGGWNLKRMKTVSTNVNGDVYNDLVIFHQGLNDEVARHVLKGSGTVIQATDPHMAVLQTPAEGWKWSNLRVAGGGDVNGDGYGDVAMISAYPGGRDYALYNYLGSAAGLTPQFQMELTANNGGWDLIKTRGATVDVTGDGKTDLVLLHQGPVDEVGRHVLKGSATGIQPSDPSMVAIQYPHEGWIWSRVIPQ